METNGTAHDASSQNNVLVILRMLTSVRCGIQISFSLSSKYQESILALHVQGVDDRLLSRVVRVLRFRSIAEQSSESEMEHNE